MEIERKWLISPEKIPYKLEELPALTIEQAYISFNPVVRVRKINEGERYILTIKRPTEHGGIAAAEAEHEIDRETYDSRSGDGKKLADAGLGRGGCNHGRQI